MVLSSPAGTVWTNLPVVVATLETQSPIEPVGVLGAAVGFQQGKWNVALVVTQANIWPWEEIGETVEKDFQMVLKMYQEGWLSSALSTCVGQS